jgi:hypothetical protein
VAVLTLTDFPSRLKALTSYQGLLLKVRICRTCGEEVLLRLFPGLEARVARSRNLIAFATPEWEARRA